MKGMISVVIPVYNVERYIRQCLESVINQTYRNLQIIIVDDGSTDKSGEICDEYAARDDRVTVIHQENAGAGAAKNTGLDMASGEYLAIIDSDDYIEENMYEIMLQRLKDNNADVVQCLFDNVFVNAKVSRSFSFNYNSNRIIKSKNYLYEMLYDWKYAVFWNKLFRKSLLQDVRFPVGRKIDDEFFTYKLICNAKKIININDCLYHYRMRKSSVMNDNCNILVRDRIDCFEERYKYISYRYPGLGICFYNHLSEYLVGLKKDTDDKELLKTLEKQILLYPCKDMKIYERVNKKILLRGFSHEKLCFPTSREYFP